MLSEVGNIYQLGKLKGEGWEGLSHSYPSLGESYACKKEILKELSPLGNINTPHERLS